MTVRDIDKGYRRIRRFVRTSPSVDVGFVGTKGTSSHGVSGVSVAQVAAFHELGQGVPRRSIIAGWTDERQRAILAQTRILAGRIVDRRTTTRQALNRLGAFAQGDMQARMARGISPPLSAATVAQKGSSTPLIDTGQLRASISFRIR